MNGISMFVVKWVVRNDEKCVVCFDYRMGSVYVMVVYEMIVW